VAELVTEEDDEEGGRVDEAQAQDPGLENDVEGGEDFGPGGQESPTKKIENAVMTKRTPLTQVLFGDGGLSSMAILKKRGVNRFTPLEVGRTFGGNQRPWSLLNFAWSSSFDSLWSGSGTQASTGQTAAQADESWCPTHSVHLAGSMT
jgi:hypothetical protein